MRNPKGKLRQIRIQKMKLNNLTLRIITGTLLGFLILGSVLLSPLAQGIVFSTFMMVGLWEFYRMCEKMDNTHVSKEMGMFIGLFIYVLLIGMSMKWLPIISITIIFPLFFSLILVELWKKHAHPVLNIAILVLGIIYVVIPFYLSIDLNLRNKEYLPSVAGMLILIWTNDTMAYFIGKKWGKHKLFARISPKKTWEGTVGGLLFTLLMGIVIGAYINQGLIFFWMISALIIGPCAIFGDLLESLFKRSLDIKDSGNILPGHGGVLDRFDAVLFSIPFFYCWHMLYFYW